MEKWNIFPSEQLMIVLAQAVVLEHCTRHMKSAGHSMVWPAQVAAVHAMLHRPLVQLVQGGCGQPLPIGAGSVVQSPPPPAPPVPPPPVNPVPPVPVPPPPVNPVPPVPVPPVPVPPPPVNPVPPVPAPPPVELLPPETGAKSKALKSMVQAPIPATMPARTHPPSTARLRWSALLFIMPSSPPPWPSTSAESCLKPYLGVQAHPFRGVYPVQSGDALEAAPPCPGACSRRHRAPCYCCPGMISSLRQIRGAAEGDVGGRIDRHGRGAEASGAGCSATRRQTMGALASRSVLGSSSAPGVVAASWPASIRGTEVVAGPPSAPWSPGTAGTVISEVRRSGSTLRQGEHACVPAAMPAPVSARRTKRALRDRMNLRVCAARSAVSSFAMSVPEHYRRTPARVHRDRLEAVTRLGVLAIRQTWYFGW